MRFLTGLFPALLVVVAAAPAGAAPEGQLTRAVHTTLVLTYFDPAETTIVTGEAVTAEDVKYEDVTLKAR